ncbi:MAG: hypothetical protein ACK5DD_08530 [Cyclobacteriaceae bacterium]|jgi:hypothetical protein
MKRTFLFLLVLFITLTAAVAQPRGGRGKGGALRETGQKVIDAAQVPEAVKQAQEQTFPGLAVTRWEQRSGKNDQRSFTHYVAVFKQDVRTTRARYDADGKSVALTKLFQAANAPEVVKSAAARYTGYALVSGEESVTDKGTFYRVRFRQGAKKLTVFLDQTGAELTKDKQPKLLDIEEEGN